MHMYYLKKKNQRIKNWFPGNPFKNLKFPTSFPQIFNRFSKRSHGVFISFLCSVNDYAPIPKFPLAQKPEESRGFRSANSFSLCLPLERKG